MGVVMETFGLRDLSGKARWEEVAAEVEAKRRRGERILSCRINGIFLHYRVDRTHPRHGGGVGWQGREVV